jgi:hypothetical protein
MPDPSSDLIRAPEQPYGVEIYTKDGIFIKQYVIPMAKTIIPQHSHYWDHITMLVAGEVAVWKGGIFDKIYTAPCGIEIQEGIEHLFETRKDETILYCIHNLHSEKAVKILAEHQIVE